MNYAFTRGRSLLGLIGIGSVALGAVWWFIKPNAPAEVQPNIPVTTLLAESSQGFSRSDEPWRFSFPADHGSHPGYQTEVWYFTGHLATPRGRRFGFQLTFLRFALDPDPPQSPSAWATREIYRGHFALTDVAQEEFHAYERYSRAALGLSGAVTSPVRVWLEDWRAEALSNSDAKAGFQLQAEADTARIDLRLRNVKPLVSAQDGGLLPAGAAAGSHLYLAPRMAAQGTVWLGTERHQVTGLAWFDHIWGRVPVGQGQLTVNRFLLQLNDEREIVALQLRRRDGSGTPITTGFIVAQDGSVRRLDRRELELEILDQWNSPRDGTSYPTKWRLRIPEEDIELTITPWIKDQEMALAIRYWGGAVEVQGDAGGRSVSGSGHVELTGYADSTASAGS